MMSFSGKKKVLLLVETSRSFGRQIIQGVSQFVMEHHNWNIIFQDRSVLEQFPEWLQSWDGNGIISRTDNPAMFQQLKRLKIPVVEVLGDGHKHPPWVKCDEISICRQVADHFWERGFRNFAFFSMGHNWWSLERFNAFQKGLATYGVQCEAAPMMNHKNDITLSVLWWKGCEEDVFQWVQSLQKPVGIFCPWDMQAFFLLNLCEDRGIAVPEDVAVVGYGNNADLCRASVTPLSSVAPNAREIGYQAAVLLDKMFHDKPLPELPILVPATHIETRLSSDIIAVRNSDVASAIRFIRNEICRGSLSVSDIAQHLNVSKSTLDRIFRKWLGHSPEEEIHRVRINRAEELLRETQFTIKKIAALLGYSSPANFIRAFRKQTQTTPENYRSQCRQN
jgi:LacI family transcriptional regulator